MPPSDTLLVLGSASFTDWYMFHMVLEVSDYSLLPVKERGEGEWEGERKHASTALFLLLLYFSFQALRTLKLPEMIFNRSSYKYNIVPRLTPF